MELFNQLILAVLPLVPKSIVQKVSARYIAGSTLDDAVAVVRALNGKGAMATVDVLGEFIHSMEEAEANARYSCDVINRLHSEKLDANLSIKLTSLGMGLDDLRCEQHVRTILTTARDAGPMFVRFDMENSPYTSTTIDLYKKLRREFSNVGVVLQAYLKRTANDITGLITDGIAYRLPTNVRLCKGIYREAPEIAYQGREEIQQNYLQLLDQLLTAGAYVGIATHDDVLINGAKTLVKQHELDRSKYEFQMLLGVRDDVRNKIIGEGYRLRVYVPFGADWYAYSIRRLKENPKMDGYIVKAMVGLG